MSAQQLRETGRRHAARAVTPTAPMRRSAVLAAMALVTLAPPAQAQITEVARSAVADVSRLTFGQLCEDRFLLRNDGTRPVDAELAVAKRGEHTRVSLGPQEQVEFSSSAKDDVELWVNGKLVATAEKEKRACKDIQGNASVAVAPLEVTQTDTDRTARYANYPFFDPWFYGMYGPGFGYGGLGFRAPFYTRYVGVPIVVSGRGRRR